MKISNVKVIDYYDMPVSILFKTDENGYGIALYVDDLKDMIRYLGIIVTEEEYKEVENYKLDVLKFFKECEKYKDRQWFYIDVDNNDSYIKNVDFTSIKKDYITFECEIKRP